MKIMNGMGKKEEWRRFLPFAIVVMAVVAYSNSFSGAFMFDDARVILNRLGIENLFPFSWGTRSIVDFTFRINYAMGMFNVADYHAFNLMIHIIAGLLLYGIVRRTLVMSIFKGRYIQTAPWVAVVSAVIWTVHPLQTESVTYICQRYESMMGMFYFLCLYFYIRGLEELGKECVVRWRVIVWFMCSMVAFVFGMGCKEVMVTVPVVIFCYDRILGRDMIGRLFRRKSFLWLILLCVFVVLMVPVWKVFVSCYGETSDLLARVSPWSYLTTQFGVILYYLRLSVIPYPLCLDYAWTLASNISEILLSGLAVGVLGVATIWGIVRKRAYGFIGVWFFVILAPTSSILPWEDVSFEHRMYLPLAAVVVLLTVWGVNFLEWVADHFRGAVMLSGQFLNRIGLLFAVCVVVVFSCLTISRNDVYQSQHSMWLDIASKRPNNVRAQSGLINSLISMGDFIEAERVVDFVLRRIESDKSASSKVIIRAADWKYFYPMLLNQQGRIRAAQGLFDDAIISYKKALEVRTDDRTIYFNLAIAQYLAGNLSDAMKNCDVAISISKNYEKAYAFNGFLMVLDGKYKDAIRSYDRAIELSPTFISAQYRLAWLLISCEDESLRDGARAVELATAVCVATEYRGYTGLDVLAAAYASVGKFDDAVEMGEKALEIALIIDKNKVVDQKDASSPESSSGWSVSCEALKGRLELYKKREPFRNDKK